MKRVSSVALATLLQLPLGVAADEADELRAEIALLKADYTARIEQLESRLTAMESATGAAASTPPPRGNNALNPAISLILEGTYRALDANPDNYRIDGFVPAEEAVGPEARSATLGESELTISANIDPYFSGYFVAAFDAEGGAEVEEANITHVGLVPGATTKFGRFLSGFGYQNEIHAHAWDFVDAPLVHQAFFGGALSEDGLQVRWLAPTSLFLEFGLETGLGDRFPGSARNRNRPNSFAAFAHLGGDLGVSSSYRFGTSYRATNAFDRAYLDQDAVGEETVNAFTGDVRQWGVDAVWKWAPNGNSGVTNLKLQAEYIRVESDGSLVFDVDGRAIDGEFEADQSGWYAQAVYQFMPRWRVGLRYDHLDAGSVRLGQIGSGQLAAADFPVLLDHDPSRVTLMFDFSATEFSRLRLQLAEDRARRDTDDTQVMLQYVMSLGSHGAHKF